jgi:hypothetical protein
VSVVRAGQNEATALCGTSGGEPRLFSRSALTASFETQYLAARIYHESMCFIRKYESVRDSNNAGANSSTGFFFTKVECTLTNA